MPIRIARERTGRQVWRAVRSDLSRAALRAPGLAVAALGCAQDELRDDVLAGVAAGELDAATAHIASLTSRAAC